MDKQNGLYVIYLNNGILFSNRKELSTDTGYNMNDPWKHVKWKKPDTKGHMYDLYEISRIGKSIEVESRLVVAKGWEEEDMKKWRLKLDPFLTPYTKINYHRPNC